MRFVRCFFWLALVGQLAQGKGLADPIVCGMEKVFTIPAEGGESHRWKWTAELSAEISESMRSALATTNDCKPYRGCLLITSSGGEVAPVEKDKEVSLFHKGPEYASEIGRAPIIFSAQRRGASFVRASRVFRCSEPLGSSSGGPSCFFDRFQKH